MLYWNTVSDLLKTVLLTLMKEPLFDRFRLVGGTALSLQLGHRLSVDIDLFTDAPYGTINFQELDAYLKRRFGYVFNTNQGLIGMGNSYLVGNNERDAIKLDLYYTSDPFMQDAITIDGARLATIDEIAAMKMDVVQRGGRKKDFWDLDEILVTHTIAQLLALHEAQHSYSHDKALLLTNLVAFDLADTDLQPLCLKGKHWEIIRLDMIEAVAAYKSNLL